MRSGVAERETREVAVRAAIALEGRGTRAIATGMPMLDHLLDQFAFHAGCDLEIGARSLDGIEHHLVEDVAIALGTALRDALGERRGIARFGSATIPMDDALAMAAVDLGGRAYARSELRVAAERVEGLDTVMVPHFFASVASAARMTLHVDVLHGTDPHHCIEASFKAFARACRAAWAAGAADFGAVPSTKGVL